MTSIIDIFMQIFFGPPGDTTGTSTTTTGNGNGNGTSFQSSTAGDIVEDTLCKAAKRQVTTLEEKIKVLMNQGAEATSLAEKQRIASQIVALQKQLVAAIQRRKKVCGQ